LPGKWEVSTTSLLKSKIKYVQFGILAIHETNYSLSKKGDNDVKQQCFLL